MEFLIAVDSWFWSGWDHRRLWVPRWSFPKIHDDQNKAGLAVWLLVAYRFIALGYAFGTGVWEWARG
jgi:hypothetical protein